VMQEKSQQSSPLVVVVNHTICPFEENAERGPISLSTNTRPGHRVPLEESLTSAEASSFSLRNVWCTGGQVRALFVVDILSCDDICVGKVDVLTKSSILFPGLVPSENPRNSNDLFHLLGWCYR